MNDEQLQSRRRSDEAAGWLARLSSNKISNEDLHAFWTWRRDPLNRAAYERIEDFNAAARRMKDDPDMRAAVTQAKSRRPWWGDLLAALPFRSGALATGALVAAGAVMVLVLAPYRGGERYVTQVGEQTTVRLDDGSKVQLNTDSELRVRFGASERKLVLERGQAFFDVAHDPARPFIVDAGQAQVRALGTRFDVRRANGDVEVTLSEGKVEVTPEASGARSWTLSPGQHIRVGQGAPLAPTPADLAVATAWTSGRIYFQDAPLADAVAEVNRYNREKIVLGAGAPRDMKINGAFNTGDVKGFVAAASEGLGLTVARTSEHEIELRGPRAPAG